MTKLTTKKLMLARIGFLVLSMAAALGADVPPSGHLPPPRAPVYGTLECPAASCGVVPT